MKTLLSPVSNNSQKKRLDGTLNLTAVKWLYCCGKKLR